MANKARSAFRQGDITKALRAAKAAGFAVSGFEVDENGKLSVQVANESRVEHGRRTHLTGGKQTEMRVRLKGINSKLKKLADGAMVVRYFYAWKGGPRLAGEPGMA